MALGYLTTIGFPVIPPFLLPGIFCIGLSPANHLLAVNILNLRLTNKEKNHYTKRMYGLITTKNNYFKRLLLNLSVLIILIFDVFFFKFSGKGKRKWKFMQWTKMPFTYIPVSSLDISYNVACFLRYNEH